MASDNAKNLPQITVINALLCLFVVMIHLTYTPLLELEKGESMHITLFAINKALTFCVPTFIFLSGFKLYLSYRDRPLKLKPYFKRRFDKIVIPYIISALLYLHYFDLKGWVDDTLFNCLFLGTISAHFYYIIVSVQLYLLFPLIFKLFVKHSHTTTYLCAIITFFCTIFLQTGYWDRFFGMYLFYFVFGMFWAKYDLYDKIKKAVPVIFLICLPLAAYHIYRLYMFDYFEKTYRLYPFFNMIYVFFAIILIYCASQKFLIKSRAVVGASKVISKSSYFIYLYHCILIYALTYDVLPEYELLPEEAFYVTAEVTYLIIIVYCILRYLIGMLFKKLSISAPAA